MYDERDIRLLFQQTLASVIDAERIEILVQDVAEFAQDAARIENEACALLCEHRAATQRTRAKFEGNDRAAERAVEADGCADAIRAHRRPET